MTPVLNLATQAPYFYDNFAFTGFASQKGRQFAVGPDGLYELTGDDDAGQLIAAHVTTGLNDLGTPLLKTVDAAYVGYTADQAMTLTATVGQADGAMSIDYPLAETADALTQARVKLGKGVKARYWQFALANNHGGDFTIETLEVLPVVLGRRV